MYDNVCTTTTSMYSSTNTVVKQYKYNRPIQQ